MRNEKLRVKSNERGITLIALVITIIVMLILAGVTINLTLGENGIFTTAQKAAKNYTDAQNKEMTDLGNFTNLINNTINGLGQSESTAETETQEIKVTEISLNKTSTKIPLNGTETLTATITPENATNKKVTWTSSDESVATVSNGTITVIKVGKATIIATAQDESGVSASCEVTVTNSTLTSQITGVDYGKNINYSVTVKNRNNEDVTLNNWRIFYNDKTTNNVYIILDGYLPNTLIPEETGMTITGTYQAYWDPTKFSTNEEVVATLKNTTYWSAFAGGVPGSTAIGSPTNAMFVNSWNENPIVNSKILMIETHANTLNDTSKLYIPYTNIEEGCYGYWLASAGTISTPNVWAYDSGELNTLWFEDYTCAVRPLVCIPSGITGTVGDTVSIDR